METETDVEINAEELDEIFLWAEICLVSTQKMGHHFVLFFS